MANMQDVRKTLEASLGNLSATRAQELARSLLDRDAAKEQVSRTAADLLEWSQRNRDRLRAAVRSEIHDQLRSMGVATHEEVEALRKRVRELERVAGTKTSRSTTTRKAPAKRKAASGGRASTTKAGRTPASET
jgi:polyhydroxyalkanoate synthesis regulator phasin